MSKGSGFKSGAFIVLGRFLFFDGRCFLAFGRIASAFQHRFAYGLAFGFRKLSVAIRIEELQHGLPSPLFYMLPLLRVWSAVLSAAFLELPRSSVVSELLLPGRAFVFEVWSALTLPMLLRAKVRVSAHRTALSLLLELWRVLTIPLLPLVAVLRVCSCNDGASDKSREDCYCFDSGFHLMPPWVGFPGSLK